MTTKNMHNRHKSVFSLLIAIAMIFSMLPVSAFASDDTQDITVIGDLEAATPATTGGEESNDDAVAVAAPASAPVGIAPAVNQISDALDFSTNPSTDVDKLSDEGWAWYQNANDQGLGFPAKTLFLSGLDLNVSTGTDSAIKLPGGSTIVLNGTNTITNSVSSGIVAESAGGGVTINGSGTLNVTSTSANGRGIDAWAGLIVEDGTIVVSSSSSYGIKVSDNFDVTGGSITASTTSAGHNGIDVGANFTMTGGTIYATGSSTNGAMNVYGTVPDNLVITQLDGSPYTPAAAFNTASPKLIQSGGTNVLAAKIVAESIDYTLFLDNSDGELRKNDGIGENVTNKFNSFGAGTVAITGSMNSWTLILKEGFDFETSAATALSVPAGTTIQVDGNATVASTLTSGTAIGISSTGAITVKVDTGKTLTVNTGNGNGTHRYGINVGTFTKQGGGTLAVTAGTCSANSYGITTGNFNMTDGVIFAITNGGGVGSSNAMRVTGNVSIGDIPIKGINTNGSAYTVDASFQDVITFSTTKIIQDSAGLPVYNAKLGNEPEPEPEPTPTPTPSSSGSSSKEVKPAPPAPVITPLDDKASGVLSTAINSAANTASSSGKSLDVKLKNVSNFTKANAAAIIAKAKALGKPATVSSDVISEDGKYVEVRVTVDPTLIKQNVRLDGYTRASQTFITQTKFTKHFENKTAIISLGQDGKFGQTAKISARLDFKGFDQSNLYLYSYDKKANKYTLITSKDYTIDRKGYLVFNTDFGGDIIVSNGKLVRK